MKWQAIAGQPGAVANLIDKFDDAGKLATTDDGMPIVFTTAHMAAVATPVGDSMEIILVALVKFRFDVTEEDVRELQSRIIQ